MSQNATDQLQQTIAALEAQRAVLGDVVVDEAIAALREKHAPQVSMTDEQRKLVTVLFADLAGWTKMSEQMDPEDVQAIQRAYFAAVTPAIEQHGGAVEKYIGDAVLAVFGVPTAHEDDPERAVRAALTMQHAISDLNDSLPTSDLPTSDLPSLRLRIGIHTGLVVAAIDADGDFVITGDTVNLASRLESAARPGTVLISEITHKLVAHTFETAAVEPIQAKGKTQPIPAFQVLTVKPESHKLRGITGLDSPLVGRETEFAALQQALNRLQSGIGGVITIVGEAGIGKSRLVTEIRKSHTNSDLRPPTSFLWLEGRCLSFGVTIPYLLWLDVLRSALGVTLDDSPNIVKEQLRKWVHNLCPNQFDVVYPYLARLLSLPLESEMLVELAELDGQTLKQRTFVAVETAVTRAARQRSLILVCEDLHWADPSSLELLRYLLQQLADTPVLFVCVSRIRKDHDVWKLFDEFRQTSSERHTALLLKPLSPVSSDILVTNLLHGDALPPALQERILSKAEGNPFFVEEVIRSLIDLGTIEYDTANDIWTAKKNIEAISIPDTLQGVLTARIDRLQTDIRHILQLASVIGRIFLYQVLATLAEEERDLESKLVTLQREELIRERARIPELEYIFKHELTREAAYNGVLKRQRKLFHRQVVEALERLFPDRLDEMLPLLAYHWEQAEDLERAAYYLLRAGDYARLAYGHKEAIDFYYQTIDLLRRRGDDNRLARTLMKLGQAYHDAVDFPRSQEIYDEAFELWGRLDRPTMPPTPHTYRFVYLEPATLDPALAEGPSSTYVHHLFSGLVLVDLDGEAIPDVAQSWQIRDNGRVYVFKIRPEACWSDGIPVTAHDFEYAWRRVLDPDLGSPWAFLFYDVVLGARELHQGQSIELGVRAEDETTLVVELVGPIAHFLRLVGSEGVFPVPRHIVEEHGKRWTELQYFACNGPFLAASYVPGVSFVYERNPHYSGPFRGNVGRAEAICTATEWPDIKRMYDQDETDWLSIPWQHVAQTRQEYAQNYYSGPSASTTYLVFDTSWEPFHDRQVRQAFSHAIDRTALPTVIKECYEAAHGGFVPHGMPGHSPGIGLPHDPSLARQLLAQAGYAQGQDFPVVTFWFHADYEELGRSLSDRWWHILGVTVNACMIPATWEQYYNRLKELPHLSLWSWEADVLDPDNFLRTALLPSHILWKNPTYWRLVESALHLMDQNARVELYRQADHILVTEAPIVPLTYGRIHALYKPWVKYTREAIFASGLRNDIIEPH